MIPVIKITLTGEQFQKLVQGDVVRVPGQGGEGKIGDIPVVEICLSDIGFNIIEEYVRAAKIEKNFGT